MRPATYILPTMSCDPSLQVEQVQNEVTPPTSMRCLKYLCRMIRISWRSAAASLWTLGSWRGVGRWKCIIPSAQIHPVYTYIHYRVHGCRGFKGTSLCEQFISRQSWSPGRRHWFRKYTTMTVLFVRNNDFRAKLGELKYTVSLVIIH